jgi:hypothetical protein
MIDRAMVWVHARSVHALLNVTHLEIARRRAEGEEASTLLVFRLLPRARMCANKLEGIDPSSLMHLAVVRREIVARRNGLDSCMANSIPRART